MLCGASLYWFAPLGTAQLPSLMCHPHEALCCCLQGTFLPAHVSEQLDDMASHAILVAAASKVKHQYAKLRVWRSALLKESTSDLAAALSHEDVATDIEHVLKR